MGGRNIDRRRRRHRHCGSAEVTTPEKQCNNISKKPKTSNNFYVQMAADFMLFQKARSFVQGCCSACGSPVGLYATLWPYFCLESSAYSAERVQETSTTHAVSSSRHSSPSSSSSSHAFKTEFKKKNQKKPQTRDYESDTSEIDSYVYPTSLCVADVAARQRIAAVLGDDA